MDLREIQNLIRFVAKSGASEVRLEMEDFKITIKTTGDDPRAEYSPVQTVVAQSAQGVILPQTIQPMPQTVIEAPKPQETKTEQEAKYITIKSPIIGTFYRKSAPNKPVLVEVGSNIEKGQTLCIIEAMKLFNEIESEVSGKIVKILVDDASPVEYDQPLFLVDPA